MEKPDKFLQQFWLQTRDSSKQKILDFGAYNLLKQKLFHAMFCAYWCFSKKLEENGIWSKKKSETMERDGWKTKGYLMQELYWMEMGQFWALIAWGQLAVVVLNLV